MNKLSQEVLENYQVRKTKKQKQRFINLLKERLSNVTVEEGGMLHNRNIVVGSVKKAKVIIGAHYDTAAVLLLPNFVMPKNILISILYSIILVVALSLPYIFVTGILCLLLKNIFDNVDIIVTILEILYFVYLIGIVCIGIPNKHTANDNTSGVITLIELINDLPPELKDKVAFVFFDNEENGLFGSGFFAKKHKAELKNKLVINIDCVSDGNHFMLVESKLAEEKYHQQVMHTFKGTGNKVIHIERASKTYYPSDQLNFSTSLAITALNKNKLGLYLSRIHTQRDIIFNKSNIDYLRTTLVDFISEL